jgi:hypothetical protein
MKSIKNVPLWLILAISSLSSGCASFSLFEKEKPITVLAKPVEKTPLNLEAPTPIDAPTIKWTIITKDNIDEVFKKDSDVFFGITPKSYEDLSLLLSEMRTFIVIQRETILKYQEYYEPKKEAKDGGRN